VKVAALASTTALASTPSVSSVEGTITIPKKGGLFLERYEPGERWSSRHLIYAGERSTISPCPCVPGNTLNMIAVHVRSLTVSRSWTLSNQSYSGGANCQVRRESSAPASIYPTSSKSRFSAWDMCATTPCSCADTLAMS